jgi:hypothetical protein
MTHKIKIYKQMVKRGSGKYNADYGVNDMYNFYLSHTSNPVSSKVYHKVINEFNSGLSNLIIFAAYEFSFPGRLGHLRILKYKPNVKLKDDGNVDTRRLAINYKATNELWERNPSAKEEKRIVYHLNEATNGYSVRWFWDKATCNIQNHTAYKFVATRKNKRLLSSVFRDKKLNIDYLENGF